MDLVLLFALPLIVANLIHHFVVIPRRLLPGLACPVDLGFRIREHRLFGDNKTYRGLVMVPFLTALSTYGSAAAFALTTSTHPFLLGGLVGAAYMLAELPNSFIKRQLGIAPGERGRGTAGMTFRIVDHTDSFIGAGLVIIMLEPVAIADLLWLGVLGAGCHIAINRILRAAHNCSPHQPSHQNAKPATNGSDTLSSHRGE